MYCDESNLDERAGEFLVYGGLIFDDQEAINFHNFCDELRTKYGIPREFDLKFQPKPHGLDHQQYLNFKRELIHGLSEFDVGLSIYLVLHDIAQDPDRARRNGINTLAQNFNYVLKGTKAHGLMLIDRFNDKGNQIKAHLKRKFSVGLEGMPYADEIKLERILGYHYSEIGQSHFTSAIDIILGSFRFAINTYCRNEENNLASSKKILEQISPLFVRVEGSEEIPETGLIFSPKVVKTERYRETYNRLKEFLADSGIVTMQEITATRNY
jgi:hypothetical protein